MRDPSRPRNNQTNQTNQTHETHTDRNRDNPADPADPGAGRDVADMTDAGNAVLEFLFLAVLLIVPLVYVLLTVFAVQRAAYAVSSASREAGRVFVAAESAALGRVRAEQATAIVLRDSGLTIQPASLDLACSAQPCLTPGATVTVVLAYAVDLPLAPAILTDAVSSGGGRSRSPGATLKRSTGSGRPGREHAGCAGCG